MELLATRGTARVDTLSSELGIPVSTIYRYVRTLRDYGFVEESDSSYTVGARFRQLAHGEGRSEHLVSLAKPHLAYLTEATGETAILTVRVGHLALCLDRLESPRPVRLSYELGSSLPLYAGASAKALLAFAPPAVVEAVLARPLIALTPRTPDVAKLRRQIAQLRRTHLSTSIGEVDLEATGIAAPVLRGTSLVCALSVAGPTTRLTAGRRAECEKHVARAAQQLTDKIATSGLRWTTGSEPQASASE